MFRFTIRDVLWLMVVVGLATSFPNVADAQPRTFKTGDQVYVRHMNHEGYGVVRGSDSLFYIVELHRSFGTAHQIPRNRVYASQQEANQNIAPKVVRPTQPDLAPLYQAIGVAMGWCFMLGLFVLAIIYSVRRRRRKSETAIDADVLP